MVSSKVKNPVGVLGSFVVLALATWVGCGSESPSADPPPSMGTGSSTPEEASPNTPAGASDAPAPNAAAAEPSGVTPSERDGVGVAPPALDAPAPAAAGNGASEPAASAEAEPPATEPPATEAPPEPEVTPPATSFPVSAGTPTIYLTGDSTVQTYGAAQAPQQGWGQRIAEFFTADAKIVNKAIGGRSSKSYIDEGRLDEIVPLLQPGDYLFAQWGINDRYRSDPTRFTDPSTTFKQYLSMYIDAARSKDAIPVLITPTPRLDFTNGAFQNDFPEYCAAIKELGAATDTRVIDLQTKGLAYYTSIGLAQVQDTISLDVLHFKVEGALQMARLVAEGVKESDLPINQFVK